MPLRSTLAAPNHARRTTLALLLLPILGAVPAGAEPGPDASQLPRFLPVPAGEFLMGSPETEPYSRIDEPQHEVTLTRGFLLARTEVTQALWVRVTGENPSYGAACDSCPVNRVSWRDAVRFCNELSRRNGLEPAYEIEQGRVRWLPDRDGFRLPTEAEWEYACRAGSRAAFAVGACLTTNQANFNGYLTMKGCPGGMNRGEPIQVGRFPPNGWGLLDMHGNVSEWCWDLYGDYPAGPVTDPDGPAAVVDPPRRVFRGGGFLNFMPICRSAARRALDADRGVDYLGLRLARNGRDR